MRAEDLIPAFSDALDNLKDGLSLGRTTDTFEETEAAKDRVGRIDDFLSGIEQRRLAQGESYWTDGDADYDLEGLVDRLETFAPTGVYFGAHPGDGSDFGFWMCENLAEEFDGFVSSKAQNYPDADYRGEWLHVSDHGNVTLYVRGEDGEDSEVWSCV